MTDRNIENRSRRSLRLEGWDYSWPWWYFVTICTYQRTCFFGRVDQGEMILSDIGRIVEEEWLKTPTIRKNVELDDFQIMPNHVHGIIIINVGATRRAAHNDETESPLRATEPVAPTKTLEARSLGAIIGQFKSISCKRASAIHVTLGAHLWQRGYHDHIIRNDADLFRIRTYILNNPLQWSLDEENPANSVSSE